MKGFPTDAQVERIKEQYPVGSRIKLSSMQDPYAPVPSGTEGTVQAIDGIGSLLMKWDNGRSLNLLPLEDIFEVISRPDEPQQTSELRLYMPLRITTQREEIRYGVIENYEETINTNKLIPYKDELQIQLNHEWDGDDEQRGLMKYYTKHDTVNQKVQKFMFEFEQIGDEMMGVAVLTLTEQLSDDEFELIKENITLQAKDGFCKDFSKREIEISYDDVNISFWSDDKEWSLKTAEELGITEQKHEMGGMSL